MTTTMLLTIVAGIALCIVGTKVWRARQRKNQRNEQEHRYNGFHLGESTKHDVPHCGIKRTPETPVNYKIHEYYKKGYEREKDRSKNQRP